MTGQEAKFYTIVVTWEEQSSYTQENRVTNRGIDNTVLLPILFLK